MKQEYDRSKIWREVNTNIKKGVIIRPEKCSICSRKGKIEAHHDDYSKPLDIRWLCKSCHKKLHVKIKKQLKIQN